MSKGNKSFKIKRFISIITLFTIFIIIGIISVKDYTESSNEMDLLYTKDTLNFMAKDNPIKISLNEKIRLYEIKEKQDRIDMQNEIAVKILEEKKRVEKERLKQEELKRAFEDEEKKQALKSSKTAYLTFDDGPSEIITKEILNILNDYEIKATFFILGLMAEIYPETLKLIYEKGHSIGNHSYSHDYNIIYKNTDNFLLDIERADQVFKAILGDDFETNIIRLPGGSFGKHKNKYVKAAEEHGYINYDWHALNGDAELPKKNKDQLVNRLKETIKGKKELIVLMHDTDTKINTVKALPEIIEHLISEGYVFKILEQ